MKLQVMSQFLVPGDVVSHERKRRTIVQSKTVGDMTRIAYRDIHGNVQIATADKNQFFNVINGDHVLSYEKR